MAEVAEQTTINAVPADVWRVLADFGDISRWASNVDHSCLMTEQADGAGVVRRIQTGRNTVLERVVEWEPEQRLAYEIEGLPPAIRSVTNAWQLTPNGDYTVVTLTSTIKTGPKPPQKAAAKVVGRVLGKASVQMLAGLKTRVESNQQEGARS